MNYQILLDAVQSCGIDSEGNPIAAEEVEPVADALIHYLIRLPNFQALVQEELDQIRFSDPVIELSIEEFSVPIPGDPDYADPFGEHWSCA